MATPTLAGAWLELADGQKITLAGTCTVGRAPGNTVVIAQEKVSRRHAIIHAQDQNEAWLVDLGSSNGTYLNDRRVAEPTRLNNLDQVVIGGVRLIYHQGVVVDPAVTTPPTHTETIADMRAATCFLLVADIIGSTQLSQRLSAEQMAVVTGGWLASCRQLVEQARGAVDKFLGDGFFAYWHAGDNALTELPRLVQGLRALQDKAEPEFRVVLHFGTVFVSGFAWQGRESLWGPEVTFAFRMKKLAGSLREPRLLSEPARAQLQAGLAVTEVGRHPLVGYDGQFSFWRF